MANKKSIRVQESESVVADLDRLADFFGIPMHKGSADRVVTGLKVRATACKSAGDYITACRCYSCALFVETSSSRIRWSVVMELRALLAMAGDQYVAETLRKPKILTRKQLNEHRKW